MFQIFPKYGRLNVTKFYQSLGEEKKISLCVDRDVRNEMEILPAVQDSNAVL